MDTFVLYDEVQFTRRDWRNRNKFRTQNGAEWVTIPVQVKNKYTQSVWDTLIADKAWGTLHWKIIQHNYSKSPFFKEVSAIFKPLFVENNEQRLSLLNENFIRKICEYLGIKTPIIWSHDVDYKKGNATKKLCNLCEALGATEYLSGPSAESYLDLSLFIGKNIDVTYFDYEGYTDYQQIYSPCVHNVSILDLLFNVGQNAPKYMKSFSLNQWDEKECGDRR